MGSLSETFGLPLAILTMSMYNVHFIDPEAEAHMEGECTISGAGGGRRGADATEGAGQVSGKLCSSSSSFVHAVCSS